jgi:uncharacterized protein (DUF927 family)
VLDTIPAELKERRQWVVWRYQQRNGKWTKPLYSARTRQAAASDDPQTWASFTETVNAWRQSRGRYDGIGYVFAADDPYCGVDLDKCISDDGEIDQNKLCWIESFNSYTETSPSSRGFHLIVKGKVEQGHNERGFEIYSSGRFFTFTGRSHHSEALPIAERQEVIDRFVAEVFSPKQTAEPKKPRPERNAAVTINDRLQKAFGAKNGESVKALFDGDTSAYGGNHSDADMALCCKLAFWSDGDPQTLDAMFRKSSLMRPKWDEKHSADGRTYGEMTINKALSSTTEFYAWRRRDVPDVKTHAQANDAEADHTQSTPTEDTAEPQTEDTANAQTTKTGDRVVIGNVTFKVSDSGVWAVTEEGDKIFVCSPLFIEADTRNTDNEGWGRLLRFPDRDGKVHQWAMPMALLSGDGREYREKLLDMGLVIPPGRKARELLTMYLNTKPPSTVLSVDRVGWHRGAYILPDETIGRADGEQVYLQSRSGTNHKLRMQGTIEEWREEVGIYCVGNSRLVFAVSTAFAAALLNLTGEDGGGFHFRGSSSLGKTTALFVAGSVWGGNGDKGYLQRWKATVNGIEAIAELHNDGLLCLDEIAECEPQALAEVAYMLANGQGKLRMSRSALARKALEWRLLFLSSGEISLADHIAQIGKRTRGGQEVRLVNIEADAGKGYGLFEELHRFTDASLFAKHLIDASRNYYGAAIRDFLKRLVTTPDLITMRARAFIDRFVADKVTKQASGEVLRVARRFGLIAFAGKLASSYGITGWDEEESVKAAKKLFDEWIAQRGTHGSSDEEAAIRQVRAFIELHGASRFQSEQPAQDQRQSLEVSTRIHNRAGFKLTTDDGIEYCILPETFRNEVCRGFDYRQIAQALAEKGYLKKDEGNHLTVKRTLPELGKIRVFVVKSNIFSGDGGDGGDGD